MDPDPAPWLIRVSLAPKTGQSHEALAEALAAIVASDPSVGLDSDLSNDRLLLLGRSEHDVEGPIDTLIAAGHRPNIGAPEVIYRKALRSPVSVTYTFLGHISGQSGHPRAGSAKVDFEFTPSEETKLVNRVSPGTIPNELLEGIERGFRLERSFGLWNGYPLLGLHATLLGVEAKERSTAIAFETATRDAIRTALRKTGNVLMEPIMEVAVDTPERATGSVAGDLISRRGIILRMEDLGSACRIHAEVPLANLFGYIWKLRSYTEGVGTFTQTFSHYAPVPLPLGGPDDFRPAVGKRA